MDEMMRVTTSFLRGEVAASNHERNKSFPPWKHQEGNQKQNFRKRSFRNQQRPERKQDRFTLLTKTPKEIFALEKEKFTAPPPMTTPIEKRNHSKFCEFYGEVGHNTDECMHLKKQIEEMLKAGKLLHIIKEINQNNGKEQPKTTKKGDTFRKDKALAILMARSQEVLSSFVNGSRNAKNTGRRRNNYPKKKQAGFVGMYAGFRTIKDFPCPQTNSGRKNQGGNKRRISRTNSNDLFYSHRRGPQQVMSPASAQLRHFRLEARRHDRCTKTHCGTSPEYTRGMPPEKGMFLGYKVNTKGLKVCPDNVDAVLSLQSPKCLKDVQKLNGKLASLNRLRVSVKGQILADFIVEQPKEDSPDTLMKTEELFEPWILFTDGSSSTDGSGAGLIFTSPEGMEFIYALRFRFDATNNEAEYEALIAGLRIAEQMGFKNLQANVDSCLEGKVKEILKKRQNRIKTRQKREAWQSQENSEAVTVDRGRKTKENAKRRARSANSYKFIRRKKKRGTEFAI
uniref:Reverse transcriptase domain-containing protein n=1 Tax=Tanacetum cinerariifolium TaxID=118510 RepID=A0A699IW57_TANCI|nr:reverse transcriptase domain-containing protein [Tanacetum cinerariifolium]